MVLYSSLKIAVVRSPSHCLDWCTYSPDWGVLNWLMHHYDHLWKIRLEWWYQGTVWWLQEAKPQIPASLRIIASVSSSCQQTPFTLSTQDTANINQEPDTWFLAHGKVDEYFCVRYLWGIATQEGQQFREFYLITFCFVHYSWQTPVLVSLSRTHPVANAKPHFNMDIVRENEIHVMINSHKNVNLYIVPGLKVKSIQLPVNKTSSND